MWARLLDSQRHSASAGGPRARASDSGPRPPPPQLPASSPGICWVWGRCRLHHGLVALLTWSQATRSVCLPSGSPSLMVPLPWGRSCSLSRGRDPVTFQLLLNCFVPHRGWVMLLLPQTSYFLCESPAVTCLGQYQSIAFLSWLNEFSMSSSPCFICILFLYILHALLWQAF